MLSLATSAAIPATGPLAALGPVGGVIDMALMAFSGGFGAQMTQFQSQLRQMTPAQQSAARQSGAFGVQQRPTGLPGATRTAGLNLLEGGRRVSFLSGLGKIFTDVLPTFGTIAQDIGKVIHPATTAAGSAATAAVDAAKAMGKTVAQHPVLAAAGAAAAGAAGMGMASTALMHPGATGKGFHMSRARKGHPSHLVRNRHMNPANGRALHRSLRRIKRFERMARHVLHFTQPHKSHGRAVFKFRKRKAA